jgi:bisphosphoglycerate-independent phosphoglycerate mutase (AlkP superfamily)
MTEAHAALRRLDDLLAGIVGTLDPERDLLVTAADHGNFEEQRHSRHTTNPALVTVWGKGHREVAASIEAITDVAPALLRWLEDNGR